MVFEIGREKTGGRKPGSTNKASTDIKSRIAALIDNQFETIQADLAALEPKDRVNAFLKFLEYILPKQREQKLDVIARLDSLNDEQLDSLIDSVLADDE